MELNYAQSKYNFHIGPFLFSTGGQTDWKVKNYVKCLRSKRNATVVICSLIVFTLLQCLYTENELKQHWISFRCLRLSSLEVEDFDGEGKDESKEKCKSNYSNSYITQIVMIEPKVSVDEMLHCFPVPILQFNFCDITKLRGHKSI